MAECLRRAGLRTGLFVSPHISCFRERIQVQGELISEADVLLLLPQVLRLCVENEISATLFEITFILACMYYRSVKQGQGQVVQLCDWPDGGAAF